ncbi:MAG: WG repeat-containing protein [Sulfuritalea sp.]|nr:WG repeat-containing protein [Sulfuritalea sp.]
MTEIWHLIERIGGGVLALLFLGIVITYGPRLVGGVFRLLWQTIRGLMKLPAILLALKRNPWETLRLQTDRSTLFTFAILPFLWLYDHYFTMPKATQAAKPNTPPRLPRDQMDSHGELTLHGLWKLFQAVHGFCKANRYPLWRFEHEQHDEAAVDAWQKAFCAALADWTDVTLWVVEYQNAPGKISRVLVGEAEYRICEHEMRAPDRHPWTLKRQPLSKSSADPAPARACRLGDVLQSRHGIDALIFRLDKHCVAPYEAIDIPPLAEAQRNRKLWSWDNQESRPIALAWPDLSGFQNEGSNLSPVLIPRAWGALSTFSRGFGPLRFHGEHSLIVVDDRGLSGVVQLLTLNDPLLGDVVGYWWQACSWPYLHSGAANSLLLEAARHLEPDTRGEVVCDLILATTGERINPPGVKVLAGTLDCAGRCVAINEISENISPDGASTRVDRLDPMGRLCYAQAEENPAAPWTAADLRWAWLHEHSEGYAAVKCLHTGLWGFINKSGAVVIAPQFAWVSAFSQDTVGASPPEAPHLMGLVDTQGNWQIPPQWKSIDRQTRRQFIVQTEDDQWGAVTEKGALTIALRPRADWLQEPEIVTVLAHKREERALETANVPWRRNWDDEENEILIAGIAKQWHQQIRRWVEAARITPPYTLAPLEGLFDNDVRERDLHEAGLWHMRVRLIADKDEGILRPKAGESGYIAAAYPVGLSCFDLSREAPVCGLATNLDAVIGIPWANLAADQDQRDQRGPASVDIHGATAAVDEDC